MVDATEFAVIAPLTHTDAYKLDHRRQYPIGTTGVLSNYTNRKSRIERVEGVVHFGLQAFLLNWAEDAWRPFFDAEEDLVADLYHEFVASILGPVAADEIGTDHIRALHGLGYLPLRFRGLEEGTLVPLRVPSFTIENTKPEFYWLVNYIETVLSASIWQPSTSATTAFYFRELLDKWAVKTAGSTAGVEWQGHDFSFRGMPGEAAAAASAAGHLLNFTGSDSLSAINYVDEFYYGQNGLVLGSVPATEHSVMCAGGNDEGDEQSTFQRIIGLYPEGIVSVVSDTWDLWNVLTNILPNLKDQIMGRDGKLVIRPDSGDPVDILTGTFKLSDAEMRNEDNNQDQYDYHRKNKEPKKGFKPEQKGVIELLWETFGGTVNEQGYKVLDSHIGAIYGDSINYERAEAIFERLEAKGFASTNIVLGVGSFTYQYVTRDTFSSAIKATWVEINGEGKDIFKDPITDSGMKKSAKGRIAVARDDDGKLLLVDEFYGAEIEGTDKDVLKTIWEDGQFVTAPVSFEQVRQVVRSEHTHQ
jgi:nicotinamide phosphoribosyltransferase